VLMIGSGGREHALSWKLVQSARCAKLYFAPGNPGADDAKITRVLPAQLDVDDHAAVRPARPSQVPSTHQFPFGD